MSDQRNSWFLLVLLLWSSDGVLDIFWASQKSFQLYQNWIQGSIYLQSLEEKKTASIPTPSFTATSYLSADYFTILWIEFGTFENIRLEHSLQEGT